VDSGVNPYPTESLRCGNCNQLVNEIERYCRNCGQKLGDKVGEQAATEVKVDATAERIVTMGQPNKLVARLFCAGCGRELISSASICPTCGTSVGTPKDKSIAVLLAVFLGCWTWVYTYKRDSTKFWVGLVLGVFGFITLWFGIGFLILLGSWIWAIADTAAKPNEYYQCFPRG
jgi:predicted amidophosphoribosyltransferase